MRRLLALACLTVALPAAAQSLSQARMQDDCLQRLRPIIPREVQPQAVSFSALGNYATYYVVSWAFTGELQTRQRTGSCTYRREGQWVRDDADALRLARELEPTRRKAQADR